MIRTGNRVFDSLLCSDAIITLRCADSIWLSEMIWRLMARNATDGVLYLQWTDYHKRYWSFDYERFFRICGADARDAMRNVHVLRAFTKDNNDVAANWDVPGEYKLIVLDSLSELYVDSTHGITHAIGKFVQLCIRKRATGVILDRRTGYLHEYLSQVSSVIIDVGVSRDITVKVLKHPCLPDPVFCYPRDRQYRLSGWL
ncbi:MAG: hypothetical protein V1861_00375 [Candidatus Micrarchaeota archaeon]